MMNFYPKSIQIDETSPRVLELRPPEKYGADGPDLHPFDMHSVMSHAPIEWMIDVEDTAVVEVGSSYVPPKWEAKTKKR